MPNTLDKSVRWRLDARTLSFQEPSYEETVEAIISSGLATKVDRLLSGGKEADVYLASYSGSPIAIKVYRLYRTSRRGGRPVKLDVMSWQAAEEYDALYRAWKAGAPVPTPARRVENMFSMRYLGSDKGSAPQLKDVRVEDPEGFLATTLDALSNLVRSGIVHGDLSAFNILVHEGAPWFIDFSNSVRVDRLGWPPWRRLEAAAAILTRDLNALQVYFQRYQVTFEVEPLVSGLIRELDRFGVLTS